MIVIRLGGGLGNQMFQYALGRRLSLERNERLLLDVTDYKGTEEAGIHARLCKLDSFAIKAGKASEELVAEMRAKRSTPWSKIRRRFESLLLRRNHIKFEPRILALKGDLYLEGFWQSPKYFDPIRQTILKDFSLRQALSPAAAAMAAEIGKSPASVSLHVRRGDYAENEKARKMYGGHCGPEYYARALRLLEEKIGSDLMAFAFSDDIGWVKENIPMPGKAEYVGTAGISDEEQMILMSLCSSHIIANSTFGWWGAWLDDKEGKIVVAPSVWIPGTDLPIDDILPPEWIKI